MSTTPLGFIYSCGAFSLLESNTHSRHHNIINRFVYMLDTWVLQSQWLAWCSSPPWLAEGGTRALLGRWWRHSLFTSDVTASPWIRRRRHHRAGLLLFLLLLFLFAFPLFFFHTYSSSVASRYRHSPHLYFCSFFSCNGEWVIVFSSPVW